MFAQGDARNIKVPTIPAPYCFRNYGTALGVGGMQLSPPRRRHDQESRDTPPGRKALNRRTAELVFVLGFLAPCVFFYQQAPSIASRHARCAPRTGPKHCGNWQGVAHGSQRRSE